MKKTLLFSFFLLALDIVSKKLTIACIPLLRGMQYPFGGIPLFDTPFMTFSLNYVVNTGAAWGIFPGYSGLLFTLRALIILALIGYLLFFYQKKGAAPLWLIVTGAIGNALDYLFYGHVIDFFHATFFRWSFPIFNLADSYITLGVMALLFLKREEKKELSL